MRRPTITARRFWIASSAVLMAAMLAAVSGTVWVATKVAPLVSCQWGPNTVTLGLKLTAPAPPPHRPLELPRLEPLTDDVRLLEIPPALSAAPTSGQGRDAKRDRAAVRASNDGGPAASGTPEPVPPEPTPPPPRLVP